MRFKLSLIMLALVVVIASYASAYNTTCLQEYANVSTCGAPATGVYNNGSSNPASRYWTNIQNVYDGNWDTYATMTYVGPGNPTLTIYVNYTKPSTANSARWQVKSSNRTATGFYNYTIAADCFNYYDNTIALRYWDTYSTASGVNCYNGAWDHTVNTATTPYIFYEEAIIWFIPYTNNSQTYNTSTYETALENFNLNISYDNNTYSAAAYLVYNGSSYIGTKTGTGDNAIFSRSINVPTVNATINMSFYWAISLTNVTGTYYYNTTLYNQTVNPILIDNCSTYSTKMLNITLYDEDSKVILPVPASNTSVEISVSLGSQTTTGYTYSFNNSNKNNFGICTENTLGSLLYLDATIKYSATNKVTEYYHIQKKPIINTSTSLYLSLYDLDSTNSQEFLITYKDSNYLVVPGAVIEINRHYLSENNITPVEAPLTDAFGRTIGHFVLNDVLYDINITKDGRLLSAYRNMRVYCATTECTLNFNEQSAASSVEDQRTRQDVTYTTDYVSSTRVYTFTYSSISGESKDVDLYVKKLDNYFNTTICSTSLSAISGTLTCSIPASYQNDTVVAEIYVSDDLLVSQSIDVDDFNIDLGNLRYIIAVLLILTLVGIGATSGKGAATLIIGLLGFILASTMYLIDNNGYLGVASAVVWIIVAAGILLWKISRTGGTE